MFKKIIFSIILINMCLFGKINVAVSIAPESFLVEKIAKNLVTITTIVEPGNSPHTYEPKPSQMKELAKAKLYFAIGVEFEKAWLKRFEDLNKDLKIIYIDKNITKYPIESGKEKGEPDPHIWLDPINLKLLAKNIFYALAKEDPSNTKKYKKNLEEFLNELDKLNETIKEKLSHLRSRKFLVFHPSWGYFAKRYNLEQIAIEVAGKEPKPRELIKIIKLAKANNIKVIIAQPEFSDKSAKIIANEISGVVIKISPISKNIIKNILKITQTIAMANGVKN